MSKYTGVCAARQDTVTYTTGDIMSPVTKELRGVSTTLMLPCEKYISDEYVFVDVFMPQINEWVSFTSDEFDRYFLVVSGWTPE